VRDLRLGVATHLAVRSLKQLRQLMDALEERYQVSVDVGQQEREIADRMRAHGALEPSKVPFVWDRNPWRLI
jgi:Ni,Fe-hydrogenase III large subunit